MTIILWLHHDRETEGKCNRRLGVAKLSLSLKFSVGDGYLQLTRALYFTTRMGEVIAEDLYIAVATILAFVFYNERAMDEGVTRPNIEVREARHYDEQGKRTELKNHQIIRYRYNGSASGKQLRQPQTFGRRRTTRRAVFWNAVRHSQRTS